MMCSKIAMFDLFILWFQGKQEELKVFNTTPPNNNPNRKAHPQSRHLVTLL